MKTTCYKLLCLFLLFSFTILSCVSVQFTPQKTEKSKEVKFSPPPAPFQKISDNFADSTWKNSHNNNTISYLSECNSSSDPNMKILMHEALSGIERIEIQKQDYLEFDQREAFETHAIGYVDGVKTEIKLLIYKKNNCIYTLSFIGLPQHFLKNENDYQKFLKSFGAP